MVTSTELAAIKQALIDAIYVVSKKISYTGDFAKQTMTCLDHLEYTLSIVQEALDKLPKEDDTNG